MKAFNKMKKQILFIFNGMVKENGNLCISGGDIRLMELASNTKEYEVNFLTTNNGKLLLNKFGLTKYKKYLLAKNNSSGILSNIIITINSFFLPTSLNNYHGVVYSSCEHLYDVIPALILKYRNSCTWFAVYHWVEDYPWDNSRGGTPFIRRYFYWLNRFISGLLIKQFSDKILAISNETKRKLIEIKKINHNKIKSVYCGVDNSSIFRLLNKYKSEKGLKYDAIFIKRLNYGKGIFDLFKIWKKVCEKNDTAKLAIVGEGPTEVVNKINLYIDKNKLNDNIDLLGGIYNFEDKIRILNSTKLFILPSYEENWAIVIGEAMACRIPVIAYRLKELVTIWKDNIYWVTLGDINGFSFSILELLKSRAKQKYLVEKAYKYVKQYDWKAIAESEFK